MDQEITGAAIRALRERNGMTQAELAARLHVSDKAVSKWENGRGFPDVSLIEPLSRALRVSVPELLRGQAVVNANRSANMLKSRFYVCPICGNAIVARGDALISCCGVQLTALEARDPDPAHAARAQRIEDEIYVTVDHPMTKAHYLSFIACLTADRLELRALYPEGGAEARFFYRGDGWLYYCCREHGLFRQRLPGRDEP